MKLIFYKTSYLTFVILVLLCFAQLIFAIACGKSNESTKEAKFEKFQWKESGSSPVHINSKFDSLLINIKEGMYGNIDEVFISKNDSILVSRKFNLDYISLSKDSNGKMGCGSNACKDSNDIHPYNYYHPKYHPYYLNSDLHSMQSITKSVASTIIGVAIQQGEIKNIQESINQYFVNYNLSDSIRTHLKQTSLYDILTMQLGLEWNEFGMSLEMESDVSAMELSPDWIAYVLDRPIKGSPGTIWNYNSGASQLLSQIISSATGQNIEEYAKNTLFRKLDIENYYWKKTPTGLPDTEGGLYLNSKDLAKIGLLHQQDGIWKGERILPENWAKEAMQRQVKDIYQDGGKEGYGYQWWITQDEPPVVAGLGYGNQIIVIMPNENIVGIIYAWNIFEKKSKYIFRDFVNILQDIK